MARILIIDDEESIRVELRECLERCGHTVVEAGNGLQALRCFQNSPPDLVITDILMSEMDGIEIIRTFKAQCPETRILAISGARDAPRAYLHWARKLGADAIRSKPLNLRALTFQVSRLLGQTTR